MIKSTDKIAVWMEASLDDDYGKMGISALRYLDNEILCVVDSVFSGKSLSEVSIIQKDIPIVNSINEAKSLGFKSVIAPAANLKRMKDIIKGVDITGVTNVGEVFHHLF